MGNAPRYTCIAGVECHLCDEAVSHVGQVSGRNNELALGIIISPISKYWHLSVGVGAVVHGDRECISRREGCYIAIQAITVFLAVGLHTGKVFSFRSKVLQCYGRRIFNIDNAEFHKRCILSIFNLPIGGCAVLGPAQCGHGAIAGGKGYRQGSRSGASYSGGEANRSSPFAVNIITADCTHFHGVVCFWIEIRQGEGVLTHIHGFFFVQLNLPSRSIGNPG